MKEKRKWVSKFPKILVSGEGEGREWRRKGEKEKE
jgi:hypothetical protein